MENKVQPEKQPEKIENRNNYKIYIALLFLCTYGLIMIYSITALKYGASEEAHYNSFAVVAEQAKYMLIGFVFIAFLQFVNYRCLKIFALPLFALSVMCIALLGTDMGVNVKGATRWLRISGMQFQVSEVVKLGCILGLAWFISKYQPSLSKVAMTLYIWLIGGVTAVSLFLISDDFSSSAVVFGICFIMSFVCAKTIKLHIGAICLGVAFVWNYVYKIWSDMPTAEELAELDFRTGRIASWLAPEKYPDVSYQWYQGIYAISRGGFLGKGLGNSLQKNIIPEAHNDFIFTILVEEMGFVGGSVLIFLFIYLLYQIICVALSTKDIFGKAMVVGIFAHIGVQTIFNIGVTLGVMPNTGLPLPFISYGGTAIFILLGAEMSIVFSVERSLWRKQIFQNYGLKKKKKIRRKIRKKSMK